MEFKFIKSILVTSLGISSIGVVTPIVVSSCGEQAPSKPVPVESIELSKDKLELIIGQTSQLIAKVLPEDAGNKNVSWTSSDNSIATVDQTGLVKAVKVGEATITVTSKDNNKSVNCKITVKPITQTTNPISVDKVELDQYNLDLVEGDKKQLTATVLPETATNKEVIWSTSDEKVATVDQTGWVKAVAEGTTIITVTTQDGDHTATCEINVIAKTVPIENVKVEKVQLDNSNLKLVEGQAEQLTAKVMPENASNKKVTWGSSDNSIVTVENGLVKAVKPGKATITATTEDGGKTATCEINVIAKTIPVENVKVEKVQLDNSNLKLTEGNQAQLTATILPETATNKNVTWKSSDNSIVTVEKGLVKAVKAGEATITVTTEDGGKTATCEINVIAKTVPVENVKVESVQLDNSNLKLTEGNQAQLKATVLPETATNKNVTWKSSDNSIATVDQTGLVTAVKAGKATITVITEDGGKTAKCEVDVIAKTAPVTDIVINECDGTNPIVLKVGEAKTLTATISPENAIDKKIIWVSNNEKVATVDRETGTVTAVSVGEVTIFAILENDVSKMTSCDIEVIIPVESVKLDKNELELAVGETRQLKPIIKPENATIKDIYWKSSDETIIKIDHKTGLVTAVSEGTATITVIINDDGSKTATCQITVVVIPVEDIELSESEIELFDGQSKQLSVRFIPENATNKNVTWSSSNESVATVDQDGLVKTVSPGEATITVTSEEIKKTLTCQVTVKPAPVESVTLNKNEIALSEGKSEQLTATILPENATNKKVTWSSSNESVATVDSNGLVTAVKAGWNAIITVTTEDGGHTATCRVIAKPVPVESVKLDKKEIELVEDESKLLTVTVLPETATNKEVTWESSDNDVATVENGLVKAVKAGEATITVTTQDGGKTATCKVTITAKTVLVEDVKLSSDKLDLVVVETYQLNAIILPENATNKYVTWKSSDEKIATVDQRGLVTAISSGVVTVTVTAQDGSGKKTTCEIKVVDKPLPVESVTLDKNEIVISQGKSEQLTATILPENATNKKVTWWSEDWRIAEVDDNGKVIAIKTGETTITATVKSADGFIIVTCKVTVKPTPVESVKLDKNKLELVVGDAKQLKATVLPETATNKKVTWSSSDKNIALVGQTGLVMGVKVGDVVITVATVDGGFKATCKVIVKQIHVKNVKWLKLVEGETEQLTVTTLPPEVTNKKVTWSSCDENIATVDQTGLVTGINFGNAIITASTEDGSKIVAYMVEVTLKIHPPKIDNDAPVLHVQSVHIPPGHWFSELISPRTWVVHWDTPLQFTAIIYPEFATNKKLIWSSKDPSIAKVDENGLVTAVKTGTTTITVTSADNNLATDYIYVIVPAH